MGLRQSLQNKYSYVYRKATCMQKYHFTLKQNGEDAFLFQTELFMGIFMFIHKK